jgi:hypothetical protein
MKKNLNCVAAPDGYALPYTITYKRIGRTYAIMDRKERQ